MPMSGWIVSGSMHTPTTTMRVPRGAAVGGQPIGHREQQRFAEQHVLAIAAGVVVGVADALGSALAHERRPRADARADWQRTGGARPVLDNLRAELVAHHDVAPEVH